MSEYANYYHDCRPHQGVGNVLLPRPKSEPAEEATHNDVPFSLADVKCERRLGGLLKHFYRAAA